MLASTRAWLILSTYTFKRKGLELGGAVLQITVGHRKLRRSFENIGWQKKLGHYKNDRPLFTHKKRILKLPNLKDLFFPNFIIQLHLSFFQNSADTRIHKERVFTIFVYECGTREWIADSRKQFLFFLHETLPDYSLWNVRINLTDGLRQTHLALNIFTVQSKYFHFDYWVVNKFLCMPRDVFSFFKLSLSSLGRR